MIDNATFVKLRKAVKVRFKDKDTERSKSNTRQSKHAHGNKWDRWAERSAWA